MENVTFDYKFYRIPKRFFKEDMFRDMTNAAKVGDVFGKPAIVTDTHCIRLCNKIGLVDGIKEPQKVEMALWKIIPPEEGSDLCHRFVMHGRAVCNARKPECEKCCLKDICRTAREAAGQQAEP